MAGPRCTVHCEIAPLFYGTPRDAHRRERGPVRAMSLPRVQMEPSFFATGAECRRVDLREPSRNVLCMQVWALTSSRTYRRQENSSSAFGASARLQLLSNVPAVSFSDSGT